MDSRIKIGQDAPGVAENVPVSILVLMDSRIKIFQFLLILDSFFVSILVLMDSRIKI